MNKSIGFYSALYVMYAVIVIVALIAVTYALSIIAPDFLSGGGGTGMSAVTIVFPPMMVAQSFYKHEQRRMAGGEGWLFSIWFTVLAFVVSAAALWIGLLIRRLVGRN